MPRGQCVAWVVCMHARMFINITLGLLDPIASTIAMHRFATCGRDSLACSTLTSRSCHRTVRKPKCDDCPHERGTCTYIKRKNVARCIEGQATGTATATTATAAATTAVAQSTRVPSTATPSCQDGTSSPGVCKQLIRLYDGTVDDACQSLKSFCLQTCGFCGTRTTTSAPLTTTAPTTTMTTTRLPCSDMKGCSVLLAQEGGANTACYIGPVLVTCRATCGQFFGINLCPSKTTNATTTSAVPNANNVTTNAVPATTNNVATTTAPAASSKLACRSARVYSGAGAPGMVDQNWGSNIRGMRVASEAGCKRAWDTLNSKLLNLNPADLLCVESDAKRGYPTAPRYPWPFQYYRTDKTDWAMHTRTKTACLAVWEKLKAVLDMSETAPRCSEGTEGSVRGVFLSYTFNKMGWHQEASHITNVVNAYLQTHAKDMCPLYCAGGAVGGVTVAWNLARGLRTQTEAQCRQIWQGLNARLLKIDESKLICAKSEAVDKGCVRVHVCIIVGWLVGTCRIVWYMLTATCPQHRTHIHRCSVCK